MHSRSKEVMFLLALARCMQARRRHPMILFVGVFFFLLVSSEVSHARWWCTPNPLCKVCHNFFSQVGTKWVGDPLPHPPLVSDFFRTSGALFLAAAQHRGILPPLTKPPWRRPWLYVQHNIKKFQLSTDHQKHRCVRFLDCLRFRKTNRQSHCNHNLYFVGHLLCCGE